MIPAALSAASLPATCFASTSQWSDGWGPGCPATRKPAPLGLELHTFCDALCGILVNFEVCEGKERMEKKEFVGDKTKVGEMNKSTALTLRFSSG